MKRLLCVLAILALFVVPPAATVAAEPETDAYQPLSFAQNWSNTGLITASDDWSGVPGIVGYRGDDLTAATGVDPQTVLADGSATPVDMNANQNSPDTFTAGGVTEFELADPVVALNGSGTADAPFLLIHVNAGGFQDIQVAYNLRDLDGSTDNAAQQVALHYRAGSSGAFTNVPAAYVADATTGPGLATLVTAVKITLPAAANNQSQLQLRIMTTNAAGNDEWVGVDDLAITGTPITADLAPAVASTVPSDAATGVAIDADLVVTFTEPVAVAAGWYSVACAVSGAHPATVSGGPTTYTLNPLTNFAAHEQCVVTLVAAQISDLDAVDPPDRPVADIVWRFTTGAAPPACGDPYTAIYAVQGGGAASPLAGAAVTVEGIVVGDFQGSAKLNGFFLQDPAGDGDPLTSDGVFVYAPSGADVAMGDRVRVQGTVAEYNGLTEIKDVTVQIGCTAGTAPAPVTAHLPEAANGDLERYEGMLVHIPETLTVSQNYFQGRYGQVTLSAEGRLYNPTNGNGLGDTVAYNARRLLVLDDGTSRQNPNPIPYIGADDTLRAGDTVAGLTGVLDQGLISSDGAQDFRLQPTAAPAFTRVNARTAAPQPVGGDVVVASMNVHNYFTTLDTGAAICGPARNLDCRGANSAAEFARQRAKTVAALQALSADVVGLLEIENTDDTAVADLVAGLNAAVGAGTYAYISPPAPGTDAIRTELIYKPGKMTPVGAAQNYQTSAGTYSPLFDRPPLAQTFRLNANGEQFSVVVNHFKSKGSCPSNPASPDADTGQGCWSAKRTAQATALLSFVETLRAADPDVLVMGDLNAYGEEDPILALTGGGLVNEVARVPAATRYTYVFDGQAGYLDHALATPSLDRQVSGVTLWHINADEPSVLDYNTEFKTQDLYTPTPYASSDHDPVLVGLTLRPALRRTYVPLAVKAAK